ncbi:hypothetical protein BGZ99_000659 [Dissophora globulifera]|uniref:Uncharacterized protein n=1 Tax=Dissophora globulifera TaxID=979702 RepID=A0A9P6UY55_9FUNG|nr:hypothetical protein BGZ99_000659 [Dissophora globulifera]
MTNTVETLKEKAAHLVHKVTGHSQNTNETVATQNNATTQQPAVHDTEHGTVNPSAHLTSVRLPHNDVSAGEADHHHHGHDQQYNQTAVVGEHDHQHKVDPDQHHITSRLVGDVSHGHPDPNNVQGAHMLPTM